MHIPFYKMHGAGNDFVVFDNSTVKLKPVKELILNLCNRRRGIGGDGLIAVTKSNQPSFSAIMEYFNSDGSRGEMCGNGLRCAALFCSSILNLGNTLSIKTDAGVLNAEVLDSQTVRISLPILKVPEKINVKNFNAFYTNTGVPHVIVSVNNLCNYNVSETGRHIRNDSMFKNGTNVNFIEIINNNTVFIRTYERGVEEETLACGTGISASALCLKTFCNFGDKINFVTIDEDKLCVELQESNSGKLYLTGPAEFAFKGEVKIYES